MGGIGRRDFLMTLAGAAATASSQGTDAGDRSNLASKERSAMAIERIGITEPAGGIPIISFATIHADLVYLCGITAGPAELGDVKDQTRQILGRIDRLLAKAGTDKSKLLTAQVWLTDMGLFADHNEVWNAWVAPRNPPVRACLHSPSLWQPGMLVEIMATAAK